jgi:signal transduction histidine kinase/ligand-binding sensor domain-containing protein
MTCPGRALHTAHPIVSGAMLAGMLLAGTPAFALNPTLDVSQYAHTAWKIRDGFAKGSILSIAQTPDGYLWLGTAFGLYRFDGVRKVLWEPPPGQHLPSSIIQNMVAARDGTLWIGTWNGLASWRNGKLTEYAELGKSPIFALVEDDEGSIWAGTPGPPDGKLCEIRDGSVRCSPETAGVGHGVFGLHKDNKGNLWVGLETGVWRWKPGPPEFYAVPGLLNGRMQGMADGEENDLLIATTDAVIRLAEGKAEPVYRFPTARRGFRVLKMLRDRDGGLWVAPAGRGIVHIYEGRTDVFSEMDGLSGDDIYDLFEDREGNIWVATINGLDRFHELPVVTYSKKQGSSAIPWGGVLTARDGSIWFANLDGLNRLNQGQVTVYRQHPSGVGVGEIVGSGLPDEGVGSLFQDSRGRIWVSTLTGIGYLENDQFVPTAAPGGLVGSLTEDNTGNLWIANRELGLLRLSPRNEFQEIPWTTFGHTDPAIVLAADHLHGGLWLGFSQGGVVWFRDGQVRSSYSATDGLGEGRVNDLRFDGEAALWIATEGGLGLLKNGRIATLRNTSGLPCDAVQWTMEDDAQSVWLMTTCGLARVARSELDAWANAEDKTARTIRPAVFDTSDGLRTLAVVGDYTPRGGKSADGKLWFMVPDGISVVDPHHLPFNRRPPPVHIERVIADGTDLTERSQLPPLVHDLQIDFTALSLVTPERVRFRYKLEGWDSDWKDVGDRRQAFYTGLGPGRYQFRVTASNNDGVWNEAGTTLDFFVAPAYYQTTWFRLAGLAVVFALLWVLYHLRLMALAREFNARVEERKRAEEALRELESDLAHMNRLSIMGELTASLAHEITQPIAAARNNARAALNFLDKDQPQMGKVRKALGGVLADADRAGDIIDRIRDQVKKAPPRKDHFDLNEAINEVLVLAQSAITKHGVSLQTRLTEEAPPVEGDRVQLQQVALNLVLNAVEAMGSVEAGPRELLISTEQSQVNGVLVTVRDSGPGIDPEQLERVFEAFYTTKSNGVGMGLSICRSIINAHGGRLWADANESRGAVFQFTLPRAENEVMTSRHAARQN